MIADAIQIDETACPAYRGGPAQPHLALVPVAETTSSIGLYDELLGLSYDTTHWALSPKPEYFLSQKEQKLLTQALLKSVTIVHR